MTQKSDYTVTAASRIAGQWRVPGDTVSLTAAQAKYEHVMPVAAAPVEVPVEAPVEAVAETSAGDADQGAVVDEEAAPSADSPSRRSRKATE